MQRKLIVMRHAKSSWSSPNNHDRDRPLNERGRRSAPLVAQRLSELDWQPQHVLSSDAQRTRETAELLLREWEQGVNVAFTQNLYLAGTDELADEMCSLSDEIETLLVLGHNPGWEGVVHRLASVSVTMKTATAALLQSDCETWSDVLDVEWKLHDVIQPRELER